GDLEALDPGHGAGGTAQQGRCAVAEARGEGVAQLLELGLVHLAHRVEHDEEADEHRHHVRVAHGPALVVIVLLLDDPALAAPVPAGAVARAHAAAFFEAPSLPVAAVSGGMRLRRRWPT